MLKKVAVMWIEVGETTRFRERLRHIERDTVSVPWHIGLWDSESTGFRGSERICAIGKVSCEKLSPDGFRIEWRQKVKPNHRYFLVLGYFKTCGEEARGREVILTLAPRWHSLTNWQDEGL